MQSILLSIMASLATKLLTEKFLFSLAIRLLRALAEKTDTKLDDSITEDLAKALGVE